MIKMKKIHAGYYTYKSENGRYFELDQNLEDSSDTTYKQWYARMYPDDNPETPPMSYEIIHTKKEGLELILAWQKCTCKVVNIFMGHVFCSGIDDCPIHGFQG